MTNEKIMSHYSKWWDETVGQGKSAGLETAWFAAIEACSDEIRREQRNLFRDVLETLQEVMTERRLYCDAWEWKYRERWDHEDALVKAAITGRE